MALRVSLVPRFVKRQILKYHVFNQRLNEVLLFTDHGIQYAGVFPILEDFAKKHKRYIRFVRKYRKFKGYLHEKMFPFIERYHWLQDEIGKGPLKIHVNTLDCRGWSDPEQIMLHSCFQILTDFVEKDAPSEAYDTFEKLGIKYEPKKRYPEIGLQQLRSYEHDDYTEVAYLYEWWHGVYLPRNESERTFDVLRGFNTPEYTYYSNLNHFIDVEAQEMLTRLIAIRPKLYI